MHTISLTSFSERDIEKYLSKNIKKELGLKLVATQVRTPAGILDILAVDPCTKIYYVIELKKDIIDCSSFAQVHKYTTYFNNSKSKLGKRVFVPMLIGNSLHNNISKAVKLACIDGMDLGNTVYRLYEITMEKGISFDYHNVRQYDYECENLEDINYHNKDWVF